MEIEITLIYDRTEKNKTKAYNLRMTMVKFLTLLAVNCSLEKYSN